MCAGPVYRISGIDISCDLVHVKVVNGSLVSSGPPSCAACSLTILDAGIRAVWLFHEDGWRRYEALDFHERSMDAEGILKRGV